MEHVHYLWVGHTGVWIFDNNVLLLYLWQAMEHIHYLWVGHTDVWIFDNIILLLYL